MKITHVCLNAPVTDGWSYQDNLLPKYHKKLGYVVSVITSEYTRSKEGQLVIDNRGVYFNEYNIKTIRLRHILNTNIKSKFKLYKNLYKTISNENPDILFVHGLQFLNILEIVKYVKKNPNLRLYVDNHADFTNSATNWLSKNVLHKIIWKKCAHLIAPYANKFYGVLPARVDFLKEVYGLPESKVELLLMGVDDDKVMQLTDSTQTNNIRNKYHISRKDFLIVTGGKIDKSKKQTLLLMRSILSLNNLNIKLIIFGSVAEELKHEFNELVDKERIQYAGWLSSDEIYRFFAASDLVVFPGRHSVFWEQVVGLGVPCIFKYWSGTDHVDVGGNCEFIYEDTVIEIREKIRKVITKPFLYKKMYDAAQIGVLKFSYMEIAKHSIQ